MDKNLLENEMQQFNAIYQLVAEFVVTYSFHIIGAFIVVLIGWIVGNKLSQFVLRICEKRQIDVTLSGFIASTVKLLTIAIFLVISLGKVGISIAPFVAALGAASLGIGLALQGPLSNYGAGITLIVTRPFVVGDTISIESVSGIVMMLKLGYTILEDEDGVEYTIPNKKIVGEIIANSHDDTLLELSVDIAYHDNTEDAIASITKHINALPLRSTKRDACVGIIAFADSGITLGIRFWAPTAKQYEARYAANYATMIALQESGITIPFPQREVTLLQSTTG